MTRGYNLQIHYAPQKRPWQSDSPKDSLSLELKLQCRPICLPSRSTSYPFANYTYRRERIISRGLSGRDNVMKWQQWKL